MFRVSGRLLVGRYACLQTACPRQSIAGDSNLQLWLISRRVTTYIQRLTNRHLRFVPVVFSSVQDACAGSRAGVLLPILAELIREAEVLNRVSVLPALMESSPLAQLECCAWPEGTSATSRLGARTNSKLFRPKAAPSIYPNGMSGRHPGPAARERPRD